ncbi:MAG: T9SS type A sorting domain-containing protein [Bacteroidetes bacterium]|nr:T9SS type A sorting domain-containing protein [Bacteroidota bacterium]
MKKRLLIIIVLLLCAVTMYAQSLVGLDPTFANNGTYLGDSGMCGKVVIQSDKKILIGGYQYKNGQQAKLIRYNEDGAIDNYFAVSGYFILPSTLSYPTLNTICLQPDGRILLGGGTTKDLLLIRLKTDGNLDSSFGNNGIKITGYPGSEYINSIALQPDGKIVSVGIRQTPEDAIQVVRYLPDGSLDSSFGNNGEVYFDWTWGVFHYPTANDIAVLSNGKIVVGATTQIDANGKYCFTALRLLPNGSLDTSFNHSGMAYTDIGGWMAYCKAMQVQPDGKILLAGYSDSVAVVRFDTTGKLDNSFGNGGQVKIAAIGKTEPLKLQPDGKILIGINNDDTSFSIYRRMPDGNVDLSFGITGNIQIKILNRLNIINGIATQADGKIIAAGGCNNNIDYFPKRLIMRFIPYATSIINIDLQSSISIHPNPATDWLTIAYPSNQGMMADVCVYDVTGRKLVSKESQYFKSSSVTINVSGYTPGVYFISIINHKGLSEQFKFVKQ